jgi:hypothetical protein
MGNHVLPGAAAGLFGTANPGAISAQVLTVVRLAGPGWVRSMGAAVTQPWSP